MTLEQLRAERAEMAAARSRILQSQEYQVGDGSGARRNQRARFADVDAAIQRLDREIARLEALQSGTRGLMYIR